MEGNSSSVIVSEMMGAGTYHVAQGRSVVFREGKLEQVSESEDVCGCPAPKPIVPPVELAKDVPVKSVEPAKASSTPSVVEMETPLVFAGSKVQPENEREQMLREGHTIATIRVRPLEVSSALIPTAKVAPPPQQPKKVATKKKGFWGFFARLFGG